MQKQRSTFCISCMKQIPEGSSECPHCGATQEADERYPYALQPRVILHGRYLIGRVLGQGGFGITYVGLDLKLKRRVAIKEYFPSGTASRSRDNPKQVVWGTGQTGREEHHAKEQADFNNQPISGAPQGKGSSTGTPFTSSAYSNASPESGPNSGVSLFLAEAQAMAQLEELPGIVRVHDTFEENCTAYLVMEYVEGETLKSRLSRQKDGRMSFDSCVRLLTPLLESLETMHRQGLIHRDISPDNIMIRPDKSACLLDLGAAKDLTKNSPCSQMVIKQGYSPLEQCISGGKIGAWTDVYAMTATIYTAVTGKRVPSAIDRLSFEQYEKKRRANKRSRADAGQPLSEPPASGSGNFKSSGQSPNAAGSGPYGQSYNAAGNPEACGAPDPAIWGSEPVFTLPSGETLPPAVQAVLRDGLAIHYADRIQTMEDLKDRLNAALEHTRVPADPPKPEKPKRKITPVVIAVVIVLAVVLVVNAPWERIREDPSDTTEKLDSIAEEDEEDEELSTDDSEDNSDDTEDDSAEELSPVVLTASGNVLMADTYSANDTVHTVFGSSYSREEIQTITFTADTAEANDTAWDISASGNSSVLAWVVESGSGYDLYIGGEGGVDLSTGYNLFRGYTNVTEILFNGCVYTGKASSMSCMFYDCSSLTTVDVSGFDTAKVTDFSYMFYGCSSLTALDVSQFNTANATSFGVMFANCSSLTSLDVSGFDTAAATDLGWMFHNCSLLEELDVSGFDTANAVLMQEMFYGCENLKTLDVSGFDTANVTNMSYMFYNCSSLTVIDVSNFDTSNVTAMEVMFAGCESVKVLDVSNFDTSKATDLGWMFWMCRSVKELDVSSFDTSNVTDMKLMFYNCSSLTSLDVNGFDTSKVTNLSQMFYGCSSLSSLDVSGFDTANVTSMSKMFYGCSSLSSLDVSGFVIGSETDTSDMFTGAGVTAAEAGL